MNGARCGSREDHLSDAARQHSDRPVLNLPLTNVIVKQFEIFGSLNDLEIGKIYRKFVQISVKSEEMSA